jgi:hypothetical protein
MSTMLHISFRQALKKSIISKWTFSLGGLSIPLDTFTY